MPRQVGHKLRPQCLVRKKVKFGSLEDGLDLRKPPLGARVNNVPISIFSIVELIDVRFTFIVFLELVLHAVMMCFVMYQLLVKIVSVHLAKSMWIKNNTRPNITFRLKKNGSLLQSTLAICLFWCAKYLYTVIVDQD